MEERLGLKYTPVPFTEYLNILLDRHNIVSDISDNIYRKVEKYFNHIFSLREFNDITPYKHMISINKLITHFFNTYKQNPLYYEPFQPISPTML